MKALHISLFVCSINLAFAAMTIPDIIMLSTDDYSGFIGNVFSMLVCVWAAWMWYPAIEAGYTKQNESGEEVK